MIDRRGFCQSLLLFSLGAAFQNKLFAAEENASEIHDWIARLDDLGHRLKEGEIKPVEWQAGMDELYGAVDIPTLCRHIDLDQLHRAWRFQGQSGETFIPLEIPGAVRIDTRLARVKKGSSIPPHGHGNMVSAFLTLSGEFHVRLYDRLGLDDEHMLVRSTFDGHQPVGKWSSVSDFKDNVHWLKATADDTYLFSVKLVQLDPNAKLNAGRIPIDPDGEALGDGVVKARLISAEEAAEKFG